MLSLVLGIVSGLRTFTAPAAVSWAAYCGWINLDGTALQFLGSRVAVALLSILALVEYVGDKLPRTPNRTSRGPLIGRLVFGALSGAALALSLRQSLGMGAVLGAVGAVIGAFAGYQIRKRLVTRLAVKDILVALPEDLVAIGLAYSVMVAAAQVSP
jgi:uncharacterized membrane protein